MNIYEKIQNIRVELRNMNLKMTGKNTYAGYSYFELDDILPSINRLMQKYKLTAIVSFDKEFATMEVIDYDTGENGNEAGYEKIGITSPFGSADLKGCHEVQSIGAVETYQRRYLYQALFDIGENDSLNATSSGEEKSESKGNKITEEEAMNYVLQNGKYEGNKLSECNESYLRMCAEKCNGKLKEMAKIVLAVLERNDKR